MADRTLKVLLTATDSSPVYTTYVASKAATAAGDDTTEHTYELPASMSRVLVAGVLETASIPAGIYSLNGQQTISVRAKCEAANKLNVILAGYNGSAWVTLATSAEQTLGFDYATYSFTTNLDLDNVVATGYTAFAFAIQFRNLSSTTAYDCYILAGTLTFLTISYQALPGEPTISVPAPAATLTGTETLTATATDPDGDQVLYRWYYDATHAIGDSALADSGVAADVSWNTKLMADGAYTLRCWAVDAEDNVSATYDTVAVTIANAATISFVGLLDGDTSTNLTPTFAVLLGDTDADPLHVQLQLSPLATFASLLEDEDTDTDETGWEHAASPYSTWTAFPAAGADQGDRAHWTVGSGLVYDVYYVRARVYDGYVYSAWTTVRFTIAPTTTTPLTVTIDGTSWTPEELQITENTGGDPSPISMTFPAELVNAAANPPTEGDAVAVAANLTGTGRTWGATVEEVTWDGPWCHVYCLQDDAYLSRKLATGDVASADVGTNLAALVTSYGSPLTGTAIDTTIGTSAAITGGYLSLREHFQAWSDALLAYLWVDASGDIHWLAQADIPAAEYTLIEG